MAANAALLLALGAGCGPSGAAPGPTAVVFDACAPLLLLLDAGTAGERAAAVANGAALWNDLGQTRLAVAALPVNGAADGPSNDGAGGSGAGDPGPAPAPAALRLRFQRAAAASHGLYDPAGGAIFLNEDLDRAPRALAVTVAHEVGHAFGLAHVDRAARPSVMNAGNLDLEPTETDVGAITAIWGSCAGGAATP